MRPPTKRVGRAPLKNDAATASKLVKPTSEQAVVEHLQHVLAKLHRLSLPVGDLGCQFLDCLELTDKIRTKVREKARELLLKEPGIIPGWRAVEGSPVRELSHDTARIFEALNDVYEFGVEDFLSSCTTSLEALRKLIARRNSGMTAQEIDYELSETLEDFIEHHKGPVRLVRVKDHPELTSRKRPDKSLAA